MILNKKIPLFILMSSCLAAPIASYSTPSTTENPSARSLTDSKARAHQDNKTQLADKKNTEKSYLSSTLSLLQKSVCMAAQKGNPFAQTSMGLIYENGLGVKKDSKKAIQWLTKAANQQYADAQFYLGSLYENNNKNNKQAYYWYLKAAEQGNAKAQTIVANFNQLGIAIPKNREKAIFWYTKAAEQGIAEAQYKLASSYNLDLTNNNPQSCKIALALYNKAAEQNHAGAQASLGMLYNYGWCVAKDYNLAYQWYYKAAHQNNSYAQHHLGILYALGRGIERNDIQAYYWLALAAKQDKTYENDSVTQIQKHTMIDDGILFQANNSDNANNTNDVNSANDDDKIKQT